MRNLLRDKTVLAGIAGGATVLVTLALLAAATPSLRLTSGRIFVGSAGNVATPVAVSGDITLAASGAVTMAANSIVTGDITDATIVSADIDQNVLQVGNLQLTNTNILNLEATPITILSAVADVALVVHKIALFLDDAGADYTESADNLVIEYADGTDIAVIEATGFIDATADAARVIIPPNGASVVVAGAGTACDTTCDGTCISGFDLAAGAEVPLACAGAGADTCLCYRPSVPVSNSLVRVTTVGSGEYGGGAAGSTLSIRIWYSRVPMAAFSSGG